MKIATGWLNIFTAEGLDEDGPRGECHDLGMICPGSALKARIVAEALRQREGWPGRVYLADAEGNPIDWQALSQQN